MIGGDVYLFQTNNDGDIKVSDGIVQLSSGLDTAVYLSLFGGNEDDDGLTETLTYWGNLGEVDKYVSETQFLLQSIPATSNNLKRIDVAVNNDLKWLLTLKIASTVEVDVSIVGLNRVNINIDINAIGIISNFNFTENWLVA